MRKYFVADAERYEEFVSGLTNVGTKKEAMEAADTLAETAKENGNPDARFAIFEEVGVQKSEVVRTVKRDFVSSRSIERKPKAEGENVADTGEGNTSSESTSNAGEGKRKRGRPSRKSQEETPAE